MYTYQQRLEYIQRLQELVVIKSNIHLTYKYKNQNKAIARAQSLQDKIINSIIDDAVYGNSSGVKNIDSTIEELMTTTLENERKRIHHKSDRYVDRAVELNAERYTQILQNRINTESIKLQAKIESELRSGIHSGLSEAQTRNILREKYGNTAKARIKNIIRDSIHTNESNISFINALNEGYSYKVWMNGAGKGKVRNWHRAKLIMPVPIDEYFDIYGSYHAQAMYPGDLYAGAENVANCRCWLRYTNRRPENLGQKQSIFNIPPNSYLNPQNKPRSNADTGEVKTNTVETIKTTISEVTKKVTSKIKRIGKKLTAKIKTPKTKSKKYNSKNKQQKKKSGLSGLNSSKSKPSTKVPKNENIKWISINRLRKKLKSFANNHIKNEIVRLYKKLMNSIKNPKIEYGFAILKDGTIIELEQKSEGLVDIPEHKKEELLEEGIFMMGHSHPKGESPLGSYKDFLTYTKYGVTVGFSTNENGFFSILNKKTKLNKKRYIKICKEARSILQTMINEFEQYQWDDKQKATECLVNNKEEYKRLFHNFVIKNHNRYIRMYQRKMKRFGIIIKFIK